MVPASARSLESQIFFPASFRRPTSPRSSDGLVSSGHIPGRPPAADQRFRRYSDLGFRLPIIGPCRVMGRGKYQQSTQMGHLLRERKVFSCLRESADYEVSVKELDAALLELTSDSYFPQGLRCLSVGTLSRARDIILEFFSQTLSLSANHLNALLDAIVEMDLEGFTTTDAVGIDLYVDKLMKQVKSCDVVPMKWLFTKDSAIISEVSNSDGLSVKSPCSSSNVVDMKTKQRSGTDHSSFVLQELLKRQASISCLSICEASLDALLEVFTGNKFACLESELLQRPPYDAISSVKEEKLIGFLLWNHWRKKNLSYLLNRRTIKLLSGSNLIFDPPKVQWVQIFERLSASTEACDDSLFEIIELSLLGFISSRWTCLIDHFVSFSCDLVPVSEQYFSVLNLLQERSHSLHSKGKLMSSKENDIFEHLTSALSAQPCKIWNLPPVLVAAALPSWSGLFRSYLNEIERRLKGEANSIRCCACHQDGKEHKDCELAERIWCLYVFHIQGSHLMFEK